jgi:hypothetical protein
MSGVVLDTNQSLIQPLYKQFISAKAARDWSNLWSIQVPN